MKSEDKFFSGIENTLHSYEDAYVPGAWEGFQQKRKRKRLGILIFRLGSAAAILLLFLYVANQFLTKAPVQPQLAQANKILRQQKVKSVQTEPRIIKSDKIIAAGKFHKITQQGDKTNPVNDLAKIKPVYKSMAIGKDNLPIAATPAIVKTNDIYKPAQKPIAPDSVLSKPVKAVPSIEFIAQTETKKYARPAKSIYDSLVNSKANHPIADAAKRNVKSITYGMVVSPAVGNQKFNFGTGVQVSYKINDKLFIGSGIAYSSLSATAAGSTSTDPSKKIQDVNLEISGFEVPIGLQYRTSGGFYVSAGIMGMTVMNNHLQYDYVVEGARSFSAVTQSGTAQQAVRVVSENKTEDSKEKINNYLGFYILSIGKKKTIGNKQFNFGPFIRVPFGGVSSEKIRLTQAGISLGFDF